MRVGIYGATGYTGFELIRWLRRHPEAEIVFATSRTYAGKQLSEAFPTTDDLRLVDTAEADPAGCDVVFLCLPHGPTTIETAKEVLAAGARVIDLSNDFRLRDPQIYNQWFKHAHTAPELLSEAVYGLPEVYREQIATARLVANPGCYPTSVLLALLPLAQAGLLDGQVIVDAKSGVSGAGRSLSLKTHFVETSENFAPYNIGHSHRHIAEMEQELAAAGAPVHIIFSPHLLPVNRGILSTIYVRLPQDLAADQVRALYAERYAAEPFVHVLPPGQVPTLSHTTHTNRCVLGLHQVDDRGNWIITSSEDNLVKGASGQALQNMNIMFGLPETTGLV
ncbi:MAG TPA: N-acetyl-gamma-glutamyl-phosphate reductase [Herpetosiphonaceae bacterium]